ncbi:MAG: rhodanese-like domain-containing protein [Chitinophagaceae bacterium]
MKMSLLLLSILLGTSSYLFSQTTLLSPDEFEKGLTRPQVQLLDVRTAVEYQNAHIKNSLQADWVNLEQFKDRVQYLDKNRPILIYCAVGGRSNAAADWLRKNGYSDVKELKGGLTAWRANSKPTEGIPAMKQMTMAEYTQLSKSHGKVLIDFGAKWCPPCKKMEPVLSQLQKDLNGSFSLANVDGGIHTDIMKELKVDALPTFIIYHNGKEIWRKQGVTDINELKKQLAN